MARRAAAGDAANGGFGGTFVELKFVDDFDLDLNLDASDDELSIDVERISAHPVGWGGGGGGGSSGLSAQDADAFASSSSKPSPSWARLVIAVILVSTVAASLLFLSHSNEGTQGLASPQSASPQLGQPQLGAALHSPLETTSEKVQTQLAASLRTELASKNEQLADKEEVNSRAVDQIVERDATIAEHVATNAAHATATSDHAAAIAERDAKIAARDATIAKQLYLATAAAVKHRAALKAPKQETTDALANQYHTRNRVPRPLMVIPEAHTGVCTCLPPWPWGASTSFWHGVYRLMFDRGWEYHGQPFISAASPRWEGRRVQATIEQEQAFFPSPEEPHGSEPDPYTFALIREPKARLISAWKTKFACDENQTGVDGAGSRKHVPQLYKLAGVAAPPGAQCLSVQRFLELLLMVHRAGRAGRLHGHVLPQTSSCFSRYPPERWSRVAVMTDQEALDELAGHLAPGSNWSAILHFHDSPSASRLPPDVVALQPPLWGGVHVAELLEQLTVEERSLLGPHLPTAP